MSSTVQYPTFIGLYPEFEGISEAAVQSELDNSSALWKKYRLHENWVRLVCLYVCHRLSIRFKPTAAMRQGGYRGSESGVTNSKSASTSSLSISNTTSAFVTSDNPLLVDLGKTHWGEEFLLELSLIMPAGRVVY